MTPIQFNQLKQYEDILRLVYFNNTYRGVTMATLDDLADLYIKISKQRVSRNWSCRACTFKFLLNVAKLYYNEKDKKDKETINVVTTTTTTTTPAPKSKKKSK